MLRENYVVILGAGSSYPYNFPLGSGLIDSIDEAIKEVVVEAGKIGSLEKDRIVRQFQDFQKEFRGFRGTIDHFLNLHNNYDTIGRLAIAMAILLSEKKERIRLPGGNSDAWREVLFEKMRQGILNSDNPDEFAKNSISFITFNYDRSFENAFYNYLKGTFDNRIVDDRICANLANHYNPIHIYGQAGILPWQEQFYTGTDSIPYKFNISELYKYAEKTVDQLHKMYKERQKSTAIQAAIERISKATYVIFLGFGYDADNLRLLDFPDISRGKIFHGTGIGCLDGEIFVYQKRISGPNGGNEIHKGNNCTQIVREYIW
jgi:hypothetical protein